MPRKDPHFRVDQVGRFYQSTCNFCLESSPLYKSKYKATKWQPVHAKAEVDDFDLFGTAAEFLQCGGFDE